MLHCPSSPLPSAPNTEDVAPSPSESSKVTEVSKSSFLDLVNLCSLYLEVTETTSSYVWTLLCRACSIPPRWYLSFPPGPIQPLIHRGTEWLLSENTLLVSGRVWFVSLIPSPAHTLLYHAVLLLHTLEDTSFSRCIRPEKQIWTRWHIPIAFELQEIKSQRRNFSTYTKLFIKFSKAVI